MPLGAAGWGLSCCGYLVDRTSEDDLVLPAQAAQPGPRSGRTLTPGAHRCGPMGGTVTSNPWSRSSLSSGGSWSLGVPDGKHAPAWVRGVGVGG